MNPLSIKDTRPVPPTTYVRTRQGARVHRRTCRWLADGGVTDPNKIVGWLWAEGMTPAEIRAELRDANLLGQVRFCKVCFTPEELAS